MYLSGWQSFQTGQIHLGKAGVAAVCDYASASAPKRCPCGIRGGLTASVVSLITAVANDTVYAPYLPLLYKLEQVWRPASWGSLGCTTLRWRYWPKMANEVADLTKKKLANEAERKY